MAGFSESVSHSEGQSGTYIPEYSQTPLLQEIAQHARDMSDTVYNWGMDRFNQNQGNIDGLMRDALSYASPQRISVDMGMAEAGVQQAGERGRQSAIRDLESYGIDPSSGRYAALDQANRVMTAASAAGAGNQQRMADQAAGNAMRNQALSAGLQNAQFGLGVGNQANAFLGTASQLKYPPLGHQATNVSDSTSKSQQFDAGGGGGGSKGGEKPPQQPQQGGGGGGKEPAPPKSAQPKAAKPAKPAPKKDEGPKKPGEDESDTGDLAKEGQRLSDEFDAEQKLAEEGQQLSDQYDREQSEAGRAGMTGRPMQEDEPVVDESAGLNLDRPIDESAGLDTGARQMFDPNTMVEPPADLGPDFRPGDQPAAPAGDAMSQYNPYGGDAQTTAFTGYQPIDPVTGQPITDQTETQQADQAGSLYQTGDFENAAPYQVAGGEDMWQVPQSAMQGAYDPYFQAGDQQGAYDSTYDTGQFATDPYFNPGDYQGAYDSTYDTTDPYFNPGDYQGDFGGTGDYGGYTDYGDNYDYSAQGFDESGYDYTDPGYDYTDTTDYNDPGYDYTDNTDYTDYTDYTDNTDYTDYGDDTDYTDNTDDTDNTDYGQYDAEDLGLDESDYGARGGAVMRGRVEGGQRRARIMPPTGYQPRPQQRPPGFARGGRVPGRGLPPPIPGQRRLDPPPQPPRPARGAPIPARGGPQPGPMPRGPMMPGNMISANGMPPPQRMAQGGQAGQRAEPTQGGFVSRELSPSGGSQTDDVNARLNAGEFVIPKDIAQWKGKEFFYKLIAQARKARAGGNEKPQVGYNPGGNQNPGQRGMR